MMDILRTKIDEWLKSSVLLTLEILNYKGVSSLHGRILSYEPEKGNILFYDDDFKKVENISLHEILKIEFVSSLARL
jgi:hypothetical protein